MVNIFFVYVCAIPDYLTNPFGLHALLELLEKLKWPKQAKQARTICQTNIYLDFIVCQIIRLMKIYL